MRIGTTEIQAAAFSLEMPFILLADDDADDRNFFEEALAMTEHPMQVVMVKEGEALIQRLNSSPLPQLIFLDLNMPRKNGAQCLAQIKNNPDWSGIPVVILSTSINEARRNQLIEEGASYCFNKPTEFSALVALLEKSIQLIPFTYGPAAITP